jgi:uncharacterized protein
MVPIGEQEIEDIAAGAGLFGAGGGGSPYLGRLLAKNALREHGPVDLVDPDELGPDALVVCVCGVGAPTIGLEKLWNGVEGLYALRLFEPLLDAPITHIGCLEVGGVNSTAPFAIAARLGLPVVDCDLMGRAFPQFQMVMPTLYGIKTDVAVADERGNSAVIRGLDNHWIERLTRNFTVQVGCHTMAASFPMRAGQIRQATVLRTISKAQAVGRLVRAAHDAGVHPVDVVLDEMNAARLFTGRVTDVNRRTADGWAIGQVEITGLAGDQGHTVTVDFQNEYLVARRDGTPAVTVPDLIILVDSDRGHAITTEDVRFGMRVDVVVAPCDPRFKTDEGLKVVGPPAFGYPDLEFTSVLAADARP